MKTKTINSILTKKFNHFVESIKDEKVKELVKKNTIITGGCITSMYQQEKVNDFDMYFTDIRTTYEVANYYVSEMEDNMNAFVQICTKRASHQWMDVLKDDSGAYVVPEENHDSFIENILNTYKPEPGEDVKYRVRIFISSIGEAGTTQEEHIEQYDPLDNEEYETEQSVLNVPTNGCVTEEERYKATYITDNAVTLSGRVQLVLRFYGNAENIHENFDFVHATSYWESKTKRVQNNVRALECILSKELIYQGSRYPLASIFRIRKFIARGYTINVGQILKMVMQLNEMDLTNVHILAEQTKGVDVHFLGEIMDKLNKKLEDNPETDVKSYVMTLIEKMFG